MSRRIFVFPHWPDNPYQTMLYLAAQAAGWKLVWLAGLDALVRDIGQIREGDVLHVHSTAPIARPASTQAEADERMATFAAALDRVEEVGGQIVWTVHNEIAHDSRFADVEVALARLLAERSRLILQLHDRTAAAVASSYRLPEDRLVLLPHASYCGIYDESATPDSARAALGIPQHAPTVGLIGQLRAYKGVDVLLGAASLARSELPELTVLLAGRTPVDQIAAIDDLAPSGLSIVRRHQPIPDEEIGLWFRASNVIALPYRRILNSGSMLLAATFATPVVLPDDAPLTEVHQGQEWVATYETSDPIESLAAQLVALAPGNSERSRAARAFAESYRPYDMSRDFLRILESRIV